MNRLLIGFLIFALSSYAYAVDPTFGLYDLVKDVGIWFRDFSRNLFDNVYFFFEYMITEFPNDVLKLLINTFFKILNIGLTLIWGAVKVLIISLNLSGMVQTSMGFLAPEVIAVVAYLKLFEAAQLIIASRISAAILRRLLRASFAG